MDREEPFGEALQGLSPAPRKALLEEVLDRLREAIVRGRFGPGGRLGESGLAEAFGAVKWAVRPATADELGRMKPVAAYGRAVENAAARETVGFDVELHGTTYEAARHGVRFADLSRSQVHAFVFSRGLAEPGRMASCVPEPAAIRGALEAREKETAVGFVEGHPGGACERPPETPLERGLSAL